MDDIKKELKIKFKRIIRQTLLKYDYKKYDFNTVSTDLECYMVIHIVDELYDIFNTDKKHMIIDELITDLLSTIKYCFFSLSNSKRISNISTQELIDILYDVIEMIIFDSSNGLFQ